jgi:hypothetical protein
MNLKTKILEKDIDLYYSEVMSGDKSKSSIVKAMKKYNSPHGRADTHWLLMSEKSKEKLKEISIILRDISRSYFKEKYKR